MIINLPAHGLNSPCRHKKVIISYKLRTQEQWTYRDFFLLQSVKHAPVILKVFLEQPEKENPRATI